MERPGSSPRVRGTGVQHREVWSHVRFIPACAGNGSSGASIKASRPVHPRVCGERAMRACAWASAAGSSPRVRGTVPVLVIRSAGYRFIPACAGNGVMNRYSATAVSVHPRVCGERRLGTFLVAQSVGSSPRVRGTGDIPIERLHSFRFIPACAGNGGVLTSRRIVPSVHPRVCGERSCCSAARAFSSGSSPRVRGTVRK